MHDASKKTSSLVVAFRCLKPIEFKKRELSVTLQIE